MCLSTVYLEEQSEANIAFREAAQVADADNGVRATTLFGESRQIEGYAIREVDLIHNRCGF